DPNVARVSPGASHSRTHTLSKSRNTWPMGRKACGRSLHLSHISWFRVQRFSESAGEAILCLARAHHFQNHDSTCVRFVRKCRKSGKIGPDTAWRMDSFALGNCDRRIYAIAARANEADRVGHLAGQARRGYGRLLQARKGTN